MQTIPTPRAAALLLVLAAIATVAVAADTARAADAVQFIACPVYRDTDAGRKSGCWIATDVASGLRYDVGDSPSKPILGRQILVEGAVSGGADICGGIVLNPVRVSVLEQRCAEALIPAEGYPSKPSVLPKDFLKPVEVPRAMPQAPFERSTFTLYFDFGDQRLVYQSVETTIERAMLYAVASKARRVTVTGHADRLGFTVAGQRLREPPGLARERALTTAEALRRLGVPDTTLKTAWNERPAATLRQDGMADASKRRVEIVVEP